MNGMMMLRPGSSTSLNLPSRSTTQALCCGTTRTPSTTNTATSATMKKGIAKGRICSMLAMMKVATTTPTILKSMLPPEELEVPFRPWAGLRRPGLGNLEGAAIDCRDVEDFAGLAGCIARDLRVPERVAVFHARVAGAFIDPGVERGRLGEIQPPHARGRDRLPVAMHPDDAGDGDGRGGERLPDERAVRIPDPRRHQGRDTEHEQVKRAAHQLGDDEDEAGDQPGKGNIHGSNANRYCGAYATSTALRGGFRMARSSSSRSRFARKPGASHCYPCRPR